MAALRNLPKLTSIAVHRPTTMDNLVLLPTLTRLAVHDVPSGQRPTVLATLKQATHLTITIDSRATPS